MSKLEIVVGVEIVCVQIKPSFSHISYNIRRTC